MNSRTVTYDFEAIQDDELYRLADEHQKLIALAEANSSLVQIEVRDQHKLKPHPPTAYEITYTLRSIVGVDESEQPKYGNEHKLFIRLPKEYPLGPADCKMITDTWHPNIKSDGDFKGTICTNHKGFGSLFYLDELVVRIGEFLQYKRYLAEDVKPYPEDQKVARWVRNFAEPAGLVNRREGKAIDEQIWAYVPPGIMDEEEDILFFDREEDSSSEEDHRDDIQFL